MTGGITHCSGSHEEIRRYARFCMAEYDLDGWTAKDLITPRPVNALK